MEFLLGLLFAPWALVAYIFIAILLEHKTYSGWAVFFGVLLLAGISPLGAIGDASSMFSWKELGYGALAYIPVGLVWSFWRFSKYCNKIVADVKNGILEKEFAQGKLDAMKHVDKISLWVFAWPFSLVESVIGDIMDTIELLIRKVFRSTYTRIAGNAKKKLEDI